jgi:starch synthase (maltosyl-transferring)
MHAATDRTRNQGDGAARRGAPRPLPTTWVRPVVRAVRPQVDGGRRPAKATVGERLTIEADAFVDGHDALWCEVRSRHASSRRWTTARMVPSFDDHWFGSLPITATGRYQFAVRARVDAFARWRDELEAWAGAGQDVSTHLVVGAGLLAAAAARAPAADRRTLEALAQATGQAPRGLESGVPAAAAAGLCDGRGPAAPTLGELLVSEPLASLMGPLSDPATTTDSDVYEVIAETAKARFSTWYEMFPRSASPSGHGTFDDVRQRLDYVQGMGFDVLYLPPVHPIGRTARKGPNGAPSAGPRDVGSPWAIGGEGGGHTAVHPQLGTLADFRALVRDAAARGIDVAIDLAFQASPDHPWVREHPSWFRHGPDGTIRTAENPPKRYEDIYPFDFESPDWRALWTALLDVVWFWIEQGVKVFRVDNPHTKPFAFWEWLLGCVQAEAPETIFLSEAFTRPRVMEQLARLGFTQSYTYFTWRTSKWEIESYFSELTRTELAWYFRPNLWPNTPDILTEELQGGGRAAFLSRLVLAATLSSNYGIYGPAFELQEHLPREAESEEYLRSEKYELRSWDLDSPASLSGFVALVNRVRREHEALQFNDSLRFHWTDNEALVAYSKSRELDAGWDRILTVVSLDHHHVQSGWVTLDTEAVGLDADRPIVAHDLLSDARYVWSGGSNFVKLDPADVPCHILALSQTTEGSSP